MTDPRVVNAIFRIGRRRRVGEEALLGAIATGLVESNLEELPGGDLDSYGWRQQRESIYGRQGLRRSINNFFDEWAQHDRPGFNPGLTAANVQRPAEQYRGRYGERMDEARDILDRLLGGRSLPSQGGGGGPRVGGSAPVGGGSSIYQTLADFNRSTAPQESALDQLIQGNWDLMARILGDSGSETQPPRVRPIPSRPSRDNSSPTGDVSGAKIAELFYDPMGAWDEGRRLDNPIGGHQHVHVGSRNRRILMAIARRAARRGMSVREFSPFDPVDPVHSDNSMHYEDQAADISGTDAQERWLVNMILRRYMR